MTAQALHGVAVGSSYLHHVFFRGLCLRSILHFQVSPGALRRMGLVGWGSCISCSLAVLPRCFVTCLVSGVFPAAPAPAAPAPAAPAPAAPAPAAPVLRTSRICSATGPFLSFQELGISFMICNFIEFCELNAWNYSRSASGKCTERCTEFNNTWMGNAQFWVLNSDVAPR